MTALLVVALLAGAPSKTPDPETTYAALRTSLREARAQIAETKKRHGADAAWCHPDALEKLKRIELRARRAVHAHRALAEPPSDATRRLATELAASRAVVQATAVRIEQCARAPEMARPGKSLKVVVDTDLIGEPPETSAWRSEAPPVERAPFGIAPQPPVQPLR